MGWRSCCIRHRPDLEHDAQNSDDPSVLDSDLLGNDLVQGSREINASDIR
jgi:hypothetical protein